MQGEKRGLPRAVVEGWERDQLQDIGSSEPLRGTRCAPRSGPQAWAMEALCCAGLGTLSRQQAQTSHRSDTKTLVPALSPESPLALHLLPLTLHAGHRKSELFSLWAGVER